MMTTTSSSTACKDRLQSYLRDHGVCFTLRHHPVAYTAQQVASVEHISGDQLAKPVVVQADGRLAMLVLPASYLVQLTRVGPALGAEEVHLVHEADLAALFADCEVGALPPFGNLYDIDVYVDQTLTKDEFIEFRAGSHTDTLRIAYADFARLVRPTVVDVAQHR
jgi:Ala-tRNA(Pro) deacylase